MGPHRGPIGAFQVIELSCLRFGSTTIAFEELGGMKQEDCVKYGAIALAVVVFGALMFVALSQNNGDFEGRTWVLTELGPNNAPMAGTVSTAVFEDGTVAGTAGCNNYFASYTTDGGSIEIGSAGSTRMFCAEPEGLMDQEQTYLTLLQAADSFDVGDDTLTLSSEGAVVLTYTEADPEAVNG